MERIREMGGEEATRVKEGKGQGNEGP